ncbi:hypothetical protein XENOCAPTIV_025210, partial [Xenoophorus captivus]
KEKYCVVTTGGEQTSEVFFSKQDLFFFTPQVVLFIFSRENSHTLMIVSLLDLVPFSAHNIIAFCCCCRLFGESLYVLLAPPVSSLSCSPFTPLQGAHIFLTIDFYPTSRVSHFRSLYFSPLSVSLSFCLLV